MRQHLLFVIALTACVAPGPITQPNDREWGDIMTNYAWIESVRKAQAPLPPNVSRKRMIEVSLETHRKLEPTYSPFIEKVKEYYERTHDTRAASLLAREKIIMGDEYFSVLSRYDKALEFYRAAQQLDPTPDVEQRITMAEGRRFVSMAAFANVKPGMKEDDVRALVGLPREDWIKQVVQNSRVYSVWIYPKEDGGASAIYFDNSVVYHTNWNAAAPPSASQ